MSEQFTECEAFSVAYDVLGLATLTYSIMHRAGVTPKIENVIVAGKKTFRGSVVSISVSKVPRTNWYETTVVMIATTEN